ncbi:MAG: glutamate racemase [candidate division WOR-3 bacterium]
MPKSNRKANKEKWQTPFAPPHSYYRITEVPTKLLPLANDYWLTLVANSSKNRKFKGTTLNKNAPIGIFDSGIGGLTIVRELKKILPNEDIIYLGDTARVPYGTKSPEVITRFAFEDTRFLINRKVKLIIVACHSVSSVCLPELQKNFSVPILGVIEPGARAALKATKNRRIGVIGTQATITAGTYERVIRALTKNDVEIIAKSTPLFVPLVEEGWLDNEIALLVAETYLRSFRNEGVDTLLLGCTHYPLLKGVIQKVLNNVTLIDAAAATAYEAKKVLTKLGLLITKKRKPEYRFYLSDLTPNFTEVSKQFLGEPISYCFKATIAG